MNLNALSQFLAVIDQRSVTGAAETLGLSQSAVTKAIKRLENELGVQLLERLPRGIAPTRFGEILARQARLADLEMRRGLAEIEALGHGTAGTLRIGGSPVWAMTLLPQAAVEMRKVRPNAHVTITTAMPSVLLTQLRDGAIDLMAAGVDFETGPDLAYEQLASIEQTVYAGRNHVLSGRSHIEVSELCAFPWVVFAHDPVAVSRILGLSKETNLPPPNIAAETNSIAAMMALTSRSDFLFAGSLLLKDFARSFNVFPLPLGKLWSMPSRVIYRHSTRNIPLAVIFLNCLRRLCNPNLGGTPTM